jgi:hypothetical protein
MMRNLLLLPSEDVEMTDRFLEDDATLSLWDEAAGQQLCARLPLERERMRNHTTRLLMPIGCDSRNTLCHPPSLDIVEIVMRCLLVGDRPCRRWRKYRCVTSRRVTRLIVIILVISDDIFSISYPIYLVSAAALL